MSICSLNVNYNEYKLGARTLMIKALNDSHADKNYKDMPNICQRYAKNMPGVILRLQIEDKYLKERYARSTNQKLRITLPACSGQAWFNCKTS